MRRDVGSVQQNRQGRCARHRPHHAHRVVPTAHNKSESCYRTELLLTHRRNLKGQVPRPGERHPPFAEGIRHPPEQGRARGFRAGGERRGGGDPLSSELVDAMLLSARAALWRQYCRLHDLVVKMVAHSERCRRFMAIPGVGPRHSTFVHDGDRRSVALPPLTRRRGLA